MQSHLPFKLLLAGQFEQGNIVSSWHPEGAAQTNAHTRNAIDSVWRELESAAIKAGQPFPLRRLCRLIGWRANANRLNLSFGPTDYKELMGTNRRHVEFGKRFGRDFLSNATGCCSVIATSDGMLVVQRRRTDLLQFPGWLHVCGGMIEPAMLDGDVQVDPFVNIQKELGEELGVQPNHITRMHCLGLVEDPQTLQYELAFETRVNTSMSNFVELRGLEHDKLLFVEDAAESLIGFVTRYWNRIVPTGLACLALYGKRRFGRVWYAEAVSAMTDSTVKPQFCQAF